MFEYFLISFPACLGFVWLAMRVVEHWRGQDRVKVMERVRVGVNVRVAISQEDGMPLMWMEEYEMPVRGRGHDGRV